MSRTLSYSPIEPDVVGEMTRWRRHLHSIPELAFEEFKTSSFVRDVLEGMGMEVRGGYAGVGLVAELAAGSAPTRILLRADMDALPVEEDAKFEYASRHPGKAHACGHDGHMAMLLGAVRTLAKRRDFDGRVLFVFQPAEEQGGGARVMIEDGLLDDYPVDAVFGMHSVPGLAEGAFAIRSGPIMAASDNFRIEIKGRGGHGGLPHRAVDPIAIAAHIVQALQTFVARFTPPHDPAVVSVTQISAGQTFNVIPESAHLAGTTRSLSEKTRAALRRAVEDLSAATAAMFGATARVEWLPNYPAVVNTPRETELARAAARALPRAPAIVDDAPPMMGSEDFAYYLERAPGCYVWIGAGEGKPACGLHTSGFDFNDALLPLGAAYWVSLVETVLAPTQERTQSHDA